MGPSGCLIKLGAKWAELVHKFMPRSRIGIFCNKSTGPPHWTLNSCFGVFRTIWVHLGPLCCLTKLGAKRAELVQKFVPRSHIRIFRNESTRSTSLDPKLMFWGVSYHLGAFATVWLPYETRCKTGRTSAKVRARSRFGIFRNECTQSTPLDPKLMFWCVFVLFGCIEDRLVALRNLCKTGRTSTKVCATKLCRNFSQRSHPIHSIGP